MFTEPKDRVQFKEFPDGLFYGQMDPYGKMQGYGIFVFKEDGSVYIGEWASN